MPRERPISAPSEPVRPTRTAAAPPASHLPPSSPRRARRGTSSAFWVLTAIVVTAMVVGVVSISALLVRASFEVDALGVRIAEAARAHGELRRDVAELSSPSRVFRWARDAGFVAPDGVTILSVRGRQG
jgi:cell division protein FtsL